MATRLTIDLSKQLVYDPCCGWHMQLDILGLPRACPNCQEPFEKTQLIFSDGKSTTIRRPAKKSPVLVMSRTG